jgi:putative PIN family toxin of toxin-antitoxin system
LSKGYVILDTCVVLRALAGKSPYSNTLYRIKEICDTISFSNRIQKEYLNKAHKSGLTGLFLISEFDKLKRCKKLKKINHTSIINARKEIQKKKLPLPNDKDDIKFVEAAIAKKAKYIITTDTTLLDLDPYRIKNGTIRIIEPIEYPLNE